jgi:hypothetical protein
MQEYRELTLSDFKKFMKEFKNQAPPKPFEFPSSQEIENLDSDKSYMMSDGSIYNGGALKELNKLIQDEFLKTSKTK